MIKLHGFGSQFGMTDPSPYVLKVDVFMRIAEIGFEANTDKNNLSRAPKGKLPFIEDEGKIIADSFFIIEHLKNKYKLTIDNELNAEQLAITHLVSKSLDENFYFCLIYSRWFRDDTWPIIKQGFFGQLPPILKTIIPKLIRRKVIKGLTEQGFARHRHEEIMQLTHTSMQSLSDLLGRKTYFWGEKTSTLDACCYAFLAQFILADINNPYNKIADGFPNLVSFCKRINNQFY